MINVIWTGKFPTRCVGEWEIYYNDKKIKLRNDIKTNPMFTYKKFKRISEDATEEYYCGLKLDEWVTSNIDWIEKGFKQIGVEVTDELLLELYLKIREKDFQKHS